ncbi:hypothetical protein ACFLMW_003762 [Salmonella enterica]
MNIQELIADIASKGGFAGYDIQPWTPDNFYAGIQAKSDEYTVKVHLISLRTANPSIAVLMLFSEGLKDLAGKEMMNVLPMVHSDEDKRGIEAAPELGKNILVHVIDGMVKREQVEPNPVQGQITMFMISSFVEFAGDDLAMDASGEIMLSEGGSMLAKSLGEGAFWGWTDTPAKEELH